MATATGSISTIQCSMPENEKDAKDQQQQQDAPSKFSEMHQNTFSNRSTSINGKQMGIRYVSQCLISNIREAPKYSFVM